MSSYVQTRTRVETYFDQTATRTWERLTSDAPVSRVRWQENDALPDSARGDGGFGSTGAGVEAK